MLPLGISNMRPDLQSEYHIGVLSNSPPIFESTSSKPKAQSIWKLSARRRPFWLVRILWSSCIGNEVLRLLLELCLKVLRALAVATARSTNARGSNPPQILYNAVRPSAKPFRMLNLCDTKALKNIVLVWLLLDRVNLW